MSAKVLFYVQHLLGVGHVRRAAALARAMKTRELDVTVALGGFPVALADFGDAECYQLPPARTADMRFSALLDGNDNRVDEVWWDNRREILLALYEQVCPDVILTEHFPFGRGQFRKELVPLLEAASGKTKIACSVRDVLVAMGNENKILRITGLIDRFFDHVLVHGQADLIPFEATFAPAANFADKISYTGYVTQPEQGGKPESDAGRGEIIVSVGGGAVGADLLRAGLGVAGQSRFADRYWRFLAGDNLDAAILEELKSRAPSNVIVEPARDDFKTLLRNCALSISQGGYNTVLDVIAARCPNLIVPFAAQGESEQSYRATKFDELGLINLFKAGGLSAASLGDAVDDALKTSKSNHGKLNMNGADETARLIFEMAEAK